MTDEKIACHCRHNSQEKRAQYPLSSHVISVAHIHRAFAKGAKGLDYKIILKEAALTNVSSSCIFLCDEGKVICRLREERSTRGFGEKHGVSSV
jgi:hypothetical protein